MNWYAFYVDDDDHVYNPDDYFQAEDDYAAENYCLNQEDERGDYSSYTFAQITYPPKSWLEMMRRVKMHQIDGITSEYNLYTDMLATGRYG